MVIVQDKSCQGISDVGRAYKAVRVQRGDWRSDVKASHLRREDEIDACKLGFLDGYGVCRSFDMNCVRVMMVEKRTYLKLALVQRAYRRFTLGICGDKTAGDCLELCKFRH